MKRDKKVLDITQDSLDTLKDDDFKRKLLLEQEALIEERALKKAKNRRFKFIFSFRALASTIVCLALISVFVCVGIFIPGKDKPANDDKNYYDEETSFENIQVEELANIFSGYNLDLDNITLPMVAKGVSSHSVYYYSFEYNTELASCKINLVVNNEYKANEKDASGRVIVKDIVIDTLSSYMIENGIYLHSIYGKTVVEGIRVYFDEFSGMSLSEDSGFEQFVAELFGITL